MSSGEEMVDEGLPIRPPQPHSRKRSHHRREEKRRHHHRDREREAQQYRPGPDRDLRDRLNAKARSRRGGGGGEDEHLSEMKNKRRNIEEENERVFREIARKREKERGVAEDYFRGKEEKERGDRSSGSKSKHHHRHRQHQPEPEAPQQEERRKKKYDLELEEDEEIRETLTMEVQEVDSASDLEEGEHSKSSSGDREPFRGAASDRSEISSASDQEQERPNNSNSNANARNEKEPPTKAKASSGSSDSSSSSSSSEDESDHRVSDTEKERRRGNGERPEKILKLGHHSDSPRDKSHSEGEGEGGKTPEGEGDKTADGENERTDGTAPIIPVVVVTVEKEEDLLPPYYPALQGCRRVEEFQLLNRIEEGTYGVVYRAKEKRTDEVVALKRLKMEKEKDGFPITSLREINTLLKAQHENIVTVREIVVGSNTDKIFLVMDYVEHDLKALMETLKQKNQVFLPEEVKCLMIQLLRAVAHLHDNWILHRDLKTSNLLLSHKGILKVGDFGLAREYGSPLKPYTPIVVTLWYRAPELLLGVKEYSTPIDVWSVGCIFGELLKMEPMFPGKSEANQLNLIFQTLGTPNDRIWPGYSQLPLLQKMTFADYPVNKLKNRFGHLTDTGIDLMNKFLTFNPAKRITAEDALDHAFFREQPVAIDPSMFPTWPAKSELGHRKAAASPKPPSGGQQFKGLKEDDAAGFFLGGGDARRQPIGAGFSLKF